MGTDRQVRTSAEHVKNMSKDGDSELLPGTTGTMDHSYTWDSGVNLAIGSSSSTGMTTGVNEWGETVITKETVRK